jgi:decaprenylphospho-beta-D-erythro-pentofuranosid-2-ulose 2-reductase
MPENTIVIVGSTSGIACALARRLAAEGHSLFLAARNDEENRRIAADLRIRYRIRVETACFDATKPDQFQKLAEASEQFGGGKIDAVFVCHGILPEHDPGNGLVEVVEQTIQINLTSVVQLLDVFTPILVRQRHGTLVAISSVAGDRGRRSNALYGCTKAAVTAYLSGLRNALWGTGVNVLTIKAGPTDTAMTRGKFPTGSKLLASPDATASEILRALRRGAWVVYAPRRWRWIMAAICSIPEVIFRRMNL